MSHNFVGAPNGARFGHPYANARTGNQAPVLCLASHKKTCERLVHIGRMASTHVVSQHFESVLSNYSGYSGKQKSIQSKDDIDEEGHQATE